MNVLLRQAVAWDIRGIQRVRRSVRENRLVSMVITDEDVRAAIEDSGRGWVVVSDGEIVAFAIGNATNGNIWALFVDPDHERRGYGKRLHDTMLDWLWSRRLDFLWLTTEPGTRAQGFYEAAGWRRVGLTDRGEMRYEMRRSRMNRVTGIGGIFFKANDPVALRAWYQMHLGIDVLEWGGAAFRWTDADGKPAGGTTIWSVAEASGDQFAPSAASFMVNYRVADLHALIGALRKEGCNVLDKIDESEYGKFGWVIDPEGNKVELWEPPPGQ
jgi:GNAT superfamily N-acetyltransferase